MASGWAFDDAVNQQIESTLSDAIKNVRCQLNTQVPSANYCQECGDKTSDARKKAIPGVQYCVKCQHEIDLKQKAYSLYNRRGSKDSQLR